MKTRLALMWVAALAGLAISAVAGATTIAMHGDVAPPGIGGAIDLTDHFGHAFSLSVLDHRPALLFFGLTHCGRTCPTALASAREVLAHMGPARTPAVLFVTLDPLSDGPDQLREFLAHFDTRLLGLTGTPTQVEKVADRYAVATRQNGAALEHSSVWYLLDAHGRVSRVYPFDTPAADLAGDLQRLQQQQRFGESR